MECTAYTIARDFSNNGILLYNLYNNLSIVIVKHILLFIISPTIWISFAMTGPYIIASSEDKNGMSALHTDHGMAFPYQP